MDAVSQAIISLLSQYPAFGSVIFLIGLLRLVFKPLMSIVQNVVESTPSKKDDDVWSKVQASSAFKALAWLIDFFGSIKVPTK